MWIADHADSSTDERCLVDVDVAGVRAPFPPYSPDSDESFVPFTVGYVEFPGYLRVEGRLTESDPAMLNIGMEMTVTAVARNGTLTYAFAPASSVNGTDA